MDKFCAFTKTIVSKTYQCVKEKLTTTFSFLTCFQHCCQSRPHNQCRRVNCNHQKSNSATVVNSLQINFDNGSALPGHLPLDVFCLSSAKSANDSSNSTTTEETASDDSLLGSPVFDQKTDRRLIQAELHLKGHDSNWIAGDGCSILQVIDELKSSNVSDPSATITSRTCSTCVSSGDSATGEILNCGQVRKINQELFEQLQEGNKRILALEQQLLAFQCDQAEKSVLISDRKSISELLEPNAMYTDSELSVRPIPIMPPPPPPPPPLPPSNWNSSKSILVQPKRRKSVPISSCPLKSFNWVKLNEASLTGTVWEGLEDEELYGLLDLKEIEKHFASASNYDAFATVRSRLSVCSMIREISVLDARRAQNCAILLSKLKLSDHEIRDAVLTMDSNDCIPKDMAEQLLKFIPTKEEMELLSPYTNSKDILHPTDRFFIEISGIKRYEQRLRCLCFKKSFKETIEDTSRNVSTVTSASKRILASKRLRRLLATVLAIGNYLNQSKRASDAFGFHLSALSMLQDVKSSVGSEYTLIHYLVEFCNKSMPDLFGLQQETVMTAEAAKISGLDIQADFSKMRDGLKVLTAEIKASDTTGNAQTDLFITTAAPLLVEYQGNFSNLENSFKEMKTVFALCCKAYAPEENYAETLNTSQFFGYFAQFLNQFTVAESQIMRKRQEQETRTMTLTRVKAKRQQASTAAAHQPCAYNQRTRRSGRISKKAMTDVNEELLTSVLLAMDQCRGGNTVTSESLICTPRQRRSFRLSAKRRQLRSSNSSSSGRTVIRRKTPTQASPVLGKEATAVVLCIENSDVGANSTTTDDEIEFNRYRCNNSESMCRER